MSRIPIRARYTTLGEIAARIGHVGHGDTVRAYASWPRDPLRLRHCCGRPWIAEASIGPWIVRTFGTAEERRGLPRLARDGILLALGHGWRTVQRYAALDVDPLPIEPGGWMYEAALADWIAAHDVPHAVYLFGWDWAHECIHERVAGAAQGREFAG